MTAKKMPKEYEYLRKFTFVVLTIVILFAILDNRSTLAKVNLFTDDLKKVNLLGKISSQLLSLGFFSRRFMLSGTYPGSSTYDLFYHTDSVTTSGSIPMPNLSKEKYIE